MQKISIIIRTKNEAKWIEKCLKMVYCQDYPDYEVILVDNHSTDSTVAIAQRYGCRIIYIRDFGYSSSLNMGIEVSNGKYIVCLSGHCIPKDKDWLKNLIRNFEADYVAGVYGRQEPLPSSSDMDKRDLWLTFGKDKKVQKEDPFFHNANSMFRRELWEQHPFDEKMDGQEDRAWAKKMIEMGKVIIYEPEASVYHYHGIHHGMDETRCKRVVGAIERLENGH